jgi:hypothetical protein
VVALASALFQLLLSFLKEPLPFLGLSLRNTIRLAHYIQVIDRLARATFIVKVVLPRKDY